jgi:hypothetical protein
LFITYPDELKNPELQLTLEMPASNKTDLQHYKIKKKNQNTAKKKNIFTIFENTSRKTKPDFIMITSQIKLLLKDNKVNGSEL